MTNRTNQLIKIYRKNLIKAFGGFCWLCFEIHKKWEFHHLEETKLKGRNRGRKERYYDIINNPDSYALVGSDCHAFLHEREFDIFSEKELLSQQD